MKRVAGSKANCPLFHAHAHTAHKGRSQGLILPHRLCPDTPASFPRPSPAHVATAAVPTAYTGFCTTAFTMPALTGSSCLRATGTSERRTVWMMGTAASRDSVPWVASAITVAKLAWLTACGQTPEKQTLAFLPFGEAGGLEASAGAT